MLSKNATVARNFFRLASNVAQAQKVHAKDLTPMIHPYTYTAKFIHFPYKYFFKESWMFRYACYSMVLTYPIYVWIHFKVNSPEAVLAWETKKRLDFEKEHKHEWDL
ncbi:hypothetical protein HDE_05482 [Halotydeus destructor]|nr:hypothetical protein HDE_05482 [Halotydeus destructor]